VVTRIAPSVDMNTRNGFVYIGLNENKTLHAGTFTQGEFELGKSNALTCRKVQLLFVMATPMFIGLALMRAWHK